LEEEKRNKQKTLNDKLKSEAEETIQILENVNKQQSTI
jgi:hypothetical protein